MKTSVILTAREGSKGFPGKNKINVLGKPLYAWVMDEAKLTSGITDFYVCSDSDEINTFAIESNWSLIPRPPELATDTSLSEDVFIFCLKWLNKNGFFPECLILLMANAVSFTYKELEESIAVIQDRGDIDSVVSVSKYNMWSPLRARRIDGHTGLLLPFVSHDALGDVKALSSARDSQGDVFFADMGFSTIRSKNLLKISEGQLPQPWMGRKIYPILHDGGLDLDYDYQLGQVEWWIQNKLIQK